MSGEDETSGAAAGQRYIIAAVTVLLARDGIISRDEALELVEAIGGLPNDPLLQNLVRLLAH